jgi:hypothetical protein
MPEKFVAIQMVVQLARVQILWPLRKECRNLALGPVSSRIRCWVSSPLEWSDCSGAATSDLFWVDVGLDILSCSDVFTCYKEGHEGVVT